MSTRGVNEKIDLPLQILLWNLVDDLKIEKDYLQVFKSSTKFHNNICSGKSIFSFTPLVLILLYIYFL